MYIHECHTCNKVKTTKAAFPRFENPYKPNLPFRDMQSVSPEMGVQPEEVETIIPEIVEKLKREYNPLKIILFGSYAYGNPTKDSDIDLFILKNTHERRVDRFVSVKRIIYDPRRKIPVSPLVYTPDELEERLRIGDDFIKEIIQKGVVLYERASS